MLEIFFVLIIACYALQVGLFIFGLKRLRYDTGTATPFVSVVIAARNEERNLTSSLRSVTEQTYPQEKFEVIVANDDSSDCTQLICNDFSTRFSNVNSFQVADEGNLRGKANALAQAIDRAKGEIILITDADCEAPPTWIEHTARRHRPDIGLVGGITLQKATKPFEGIQSLDWAYILGVASAMAALGHSLGSIGNNLSFRKEAYDAVGGYRNVKFSVTEDYTLVQGIIATKRWKHLYPVDPLVLVFSQPCPTWFDLLRQKHRWGKGGLDMKLAGLLVMAVTYALITCGVATFLMVGVVQGIIAFMAKSVLDYFFLYHVLSRLQQTKELRFFWWFELYFIVYVTLLPLVVLFGGKVVWKGRSY